jgi:hypothetical protein
VLLSGVILMVGPYWWAIIRGNRYRHMPDVAEWKRQSVVESVDLAKELEEVRRIVQSRANLPEKG